MRFFVENQVVQAQPFYVWVGWAFLNSMATVKLFGPIKCRL